MGASFRIVALAAVAALSCGCIETVHKEVDVAPDRRLVVLSIPASDEGGAPTASFGQDSRAVLSTSSDDILVVWALPADGIIDSVGESVPATDLRVRVTPSVSEPGFGDCGRCLTAPGRSFMRLVEGESCPPPLDAEVKVLGSADLSIAADWRSRVRIERAGACPCSAPADLDGADLVVEATGVRPDPEAIEAAAVLEDGTVGLFASEYFEIQRPDGTKVHQGRFDGPWCDAPDLRRPPFEHSIFDVVASGDRFLVGTESSSQRVARVVAVDREGRSSTLPITGPPPLRPVRLRPIEGSDEVFVVGAFGNVVANLAGYRCQVLPDQLACNQVFDTTEGAFLDDVWDAEFGEALVAVSSAGSWLAAWPDGAGGWTPLSGRGPTSVQTESGRFAVGFQTVARVGDRLWACAHSITSPVGAFVLTATIGDIPTPLQWSWRKTEVSTGCQFFLREGDQRILPLFNGNALIMDDSGERPEVVPLADIVGFADRIKRVLGTVGDQRIWVRRDGAAFRQRVFTRTSTLVFGPPQPVIGAPNSVTYPDGDGFRALGAAGASYTIQPDPDRSTVITAGAITGLASDQVPRAVAPDSRRGDYLMVGRGLASFAARLDGDTATPFELPPSVVTNEPDLLAVAEVAPGRHIVAGAMGTVLLIDGTEVRTIELDWDDPYTAEVETQMSPVQFCQLPPHLGSTWGEAGDRWRTVSSDGRGVAWIGGCWSSLFRIIVAGDRVEATRFSRGRAAESIGTGPDGVHFASVIAHCGDDMDVLIQRAGVSSGTSAAIWSHRISETGEGVLEERLAFRSLARAPLAIVGPPRAITLVANSGGGTIASIAGLSEAEPFTSKVTLYQAVAHPSGSVLVTAEHGRLFVGHSCQ